jgi:hypothetical protein
MEAVILRLHSSPKRGRRPLPTHSIPLKNTQNASISRDVDSSTLSSLRRQWSRPCVRQLRCQPQVGQLLQRVLKGTMMATPGRLRVRVATRVKTRRSLEKM